MKAQCYLCQVSGSSKVKFDPKVHRICATCRDRLLELAQREFEFARRKQTVLVTTKQSAKASRKVNLTTGCAVDLEDEEGFEHLFNAIVGEVTTRLEDARDLSQKGWGAIYDMCVHELHFVAGQLHCIGSGIDMNMLFDEFGVQWDRMIARLRGDKTDR